ncbi:hypothetical protein [Flavivirga eckloniae]|nr:hypothetical protein [Flavivirga eckloniae]
MVCICLPLGCNHKKSDAEILKLPNKLYVITVKKKSDTITISNIEDIDKINKIINKGEVSLAKLNIKYWLEYSDNESQVRIGVSGERFLFHGKNYKSSTNLEQLIDDILGNAPN